MFLDHAWSNSENWILPAQAAGMTAVGAGVGAALPKLAGAAAGRGKGALVGAAAGVALGAVADVALFALIAG
jgi:hypothetical protein